MPTLSTLDIDNFMSHPATTIDFSPGINLITGSNRSGKTNVLRALRWVLFNDGPAYNDDPALDSLRYGSGDTKAPHARVRLTISDGSYVERFRSAKLNEYRLRLVDGEEERHSGPGQGFYEPVAQVTGIFPIDIAGDELILGWQGVFDRKLLVGETPATADKQLTHMIGVNVLEGAARTADTDRRHLNAEIMRKTEEMEELRRHIESFAGIDAVEAATEVANRAISNLDSHTIKWSDSVLAFQATRGLAAWLEPAQGAAENASERLSAVWGTADALTRCEAATAAVAGAIALRSRSVVLATVDLTGAQASLQRAVELTAGLGDAETWCGAAKQAHTALLGAQTKGRWAAEEQGTVTEELGALETQLRTLVGSVCPHCGAGSVCPVCGASTQVEEGK